MQQPNRVSWYEEKALLRQRAEQALYTNPLDPTDPCNVLTLEAVLPTAAAPHSDEARHAARDAYDAGGDLEPNAREGRRFQHRRHPKGDGGGAGNVPVATRSSNAADEENLLVVRALKRSRRGSAGVASSPTPLSVSLTSVSLVPVAESYPTDASLFFVVPCSDFLHPTSVAVVRPDGDDGGALDEDTRRLVGAYLKRVQWIEKHRALGTFRDFTEKERVREEMLSTVGRRKAFSRKRRAEEGEGQ